MKKLVYLVGASLDNFIGHEDGSADGFAPFAEGQHVTDFFSSITRFDTILMGRKTYEYGFQFGMKAGDPAYPFHPMKNYVFSRSMQFESNEQVVLVQKDEVETVKQLKAEDGKDIWLCGGAEFAATLVEHELIDELIVKLYPVVFGTGLRMFGSSTKAFSLEQYRAQLYPNGAAFLSYHVRYQ